MDGKEEFVFVGEMVVKTLAASPVVVAVAPLAAAVVPLAVVAALFEVVAGKDVEEKMRKDSFHDHVKLHITCKRGYLAWGYLREEIEFGSLPVLFQRREPDLGCLGSEWTPFVISPDLIGLVEVAP